MPGADDQGCHASGVSAPHDRTTHAMEPEPSDLSMLGSPLETLKDYEILEHIGGGTFGEVTLNRRRLTNEATRTKP